MATRFVLIQPSHAGNVGAAARALKVMGFDDLVLVQPRWDDVLTRQETLDQDVPQDAIYRLQNGQIDRFDCEPPA